MTSAVSYWKILTNRETGPLLLAANFGRLSGGLVPFGLVAFYTDRNEPVFAGIASVTFMVISSLTAPYKGRLVTRYSPRTAILPMSLIFALLVTAGVSLDVTGFGFAPAITGISAGSAFAPPTPAVVRSVWTNISDTQQMNRALHALDSTTEELTFAISPLITAFLWSTIGPFWSIPIGLFAGLIGNATIVWLASRPPASSRVLMTQPRTSQGCDNIENTNGTHKRALSLYLRPSATGLLLPMLGLGVVMGGLSLVLPSWAGENLGNQSASGLLLAIISFAGFAAGLVFGRLPERWVSARLQYQMSAALISVGALFFSLSDDIVGAICAAILIGVGMTPMFIASYAMVGDYFSGHEHTEINAALGSTFNIGDGLASLLCGFALVALATGQVLLLLGVCALALSFTAVFLPRVDRKREARGEAPVDEHNAAA